MPLEPVLLLTKPRPANRYPADRIVVLLPSPELVRVYRTGHGQIVAKQRPYPGQGRPWGRPRKNYVIGPEQHGGMIMRNGVMVPFSGYWVGSLIVPMLIRSPHTVEKIDVMEALYGDDVDGGPDYAWRMVDVWLHRARHVLRPLDIGINTDWGRGWSAVDLSNARPLRNTCPTRERKTQYRGI